MGDSETPDGPDTRAAPPVPAGAAHDSDNPGNRAAARTESVLLFDALADENTSAEERQRCRDELVRLHLPLVDHCARRFLNRGEPLDDLIQVGTIGLIKAVDRFDTGRGIEFSTYATPTIIGEIKRHFRDKGWAIRVPRRLQELRIAITATTADLSQELGRSPTPRELAETLDVGLDQVVQAIESAHAYATVSLDSGDSTGGTASLQESLGGLDDRLETVETRESVRPLLEQLPDREKQLLTLRFFREMTQAQIAAEIGVSQMHVSRLLNRTLAHLRERLEPSEE